MNFFLCFDIFTFNSFFSYESNKKVASCPGLFFSVVLYGFLLYTFLKSDMMQKTNPQTRDEIVAQTDNVIKVEFSNENIFPFILILDQEKNSYNYFDPSFWTINFFSSSISLMNSSIMVNCSDITDNPNYSGGLCFNNETKFNLSVNNTSELAYFGFYITLCSNSSDSDIVCRPYDEIYHFVKGKALVFTFLESTFDLNNYENPVVSNLNHAFVKTIINPEFREDYSLGIMEIEFTQENNVIYDEKKTRIYYQQDYIGNNFDFYSYEKPGNTNSEILPLVLTLTVSTSPNKRVITRKYQQLTDVLGKLGGLFSMAKLLGGIFLSIFPEIKMLKAFLNKLYLIPARKLKKNGRKLSKPLQKEKKIELTNINIEQSKNYSQALKNEISMKDKENLENPNFPISISNPLSSYLQKDQEIENINEDKGSNGRNLDDSNKSIFNEFFIGNKKNENINNKKENLLFCLENMRKRVNEKISEDFTFSSLTYLKNKIRAVYNKPSLNAEGKMIVYADQVYQKETNVLLLFKRLQDIEKMKYLLLTRKQRKLFELMKPSLPSFDDEEEEKEIDEKTPFSRTKMSSLWVADSEEQEKREVNEILDFYLDKIKNDEGIDEIDKKIIEFFN